MEVWNNASIDLGLQIVGYLAAVGLGMILHSFFRPTRRVAAVSTGHPTSEETRPQSSARFEESSVEFINLNRPTPKQSTARTSAPTGRRNRVEVMDLARKLVRAGATEEVIRRTVPISEGELAMLRHEQSL